MKADPKGEVKIDWNSLKAQVDKINVVEMRTVPVDLSKPSTVVDTDVIEIVNKIPDITNLATTVALTTKLKELKSKYVILLIRQMQKLFPI